MRYVATLEGSEHELEVEELSGHSYRITLGGTKFEVDLRQVGKSSFSILIGDRSFDLEVVPEGEQMMVASRDGAARVTLEDPIRRSIRGHRGPRQISGRAEIKAQMPGRVINVLVKVDEEVAQQHGLLIVEAMKMENEIKAPKAGKVVEIRVQAGQTVEKGDLLMVIE